VACDLVTEPMTRANSNEFRIRPYHKTDRSSVRNICAATCWMGNKDLRRIPDEWIWAEFWTRYFTDIERANCFIVESVEDRGVCGYLTGTVDLRRHDRYLWRVLGGIVAHVIRRRLMRKRQSRQAILAMIRSMLRGEAHMSASLLRDYPATFHANLLPCARGKGLGRKLLRAWLQRLAALGVRGIHAQPLNINGPMQKLLKSEGFREAKRKQTRAWDYIDPQPIEIVTYVREV